jgi:hypothetical protein
MNNSQSWQGEKKASLLIAVFKHERTNMIQEMHAMNHRADFGRAVIRPTLLAELPAGN